MCMYPRSSWRRAVHDRAARARFLRLITILQWSFKASDLEIQKKEMAKGSSSPTLEAAIIKLREIVLATKNGALIGGEDSLVAKLGASRSTVRQAARLLEREGLLRV